MLKDSYLFFFCSGEAICIQVFTVKKPEKGDGTNNFLSREKETTRRVIAPKSEGSVNGTLYARTKNCDVYFWKEVPIFMNEGVFVSRTQIMFHNYGATLIPFRYKFKFFDVTYDH